MKKNKYTYLIIIFLLFVIIGLISYIIINKKAEKDNEDKNITNYTSYNRWDEIILSNNSKWVVIEDSPKDSEYVTMLSVDSFEYDNDYWELISDELYGYNKDFEYDNSNLKKYLETYIVKKIPVNLKEVNNYKIRLITLDEIHNLDENWKKLDTIMSENSDWETNGNNVSDNSKKYLLNLLTMTENTDNYSDGQKYFMLYSTTISHANRNEDGSNNNLKNDIYYISNYPLGLPELKPVINVHKNELKEEVTEKDNEINDKYTLEDFTKIVNEELGFLKSKKKLTDLSDAEKTYMIFNVSEIKYRNENFNISDLENAKKNSSLRELEIEYTDIFETYNAYVLVENEIRYKLNKDTGEYSYVGYGHGGYRIYTPEFLIDFKTKDNQYILSYKYVIIDGGDTGPSDQYLYYTMEDALENKNNSKKEFLLADENWETAAYRQQSQINTYINDNYETFKSELETYNYVFEVHDGNIVLVDFYRN